MRFKCTFKLNKLSLPSSLLLSQNAGSGVLKTFPKYDVAKTRIFSFHVLV